MARGSEASVRWRQGKIIFLAPTRPLVNQQIEACRKFMGIPEVPALSSGHIRLMPCFHTGPVLCYHNACQSQRLYLLQTVDCTATTTVM